MSEKLNTRKYEGHTEGPWTVFVDDNDYPNPLLLQIEGPTHTIAYDIDRPSDKIKANKATANLIADAPLLLEEVKRLNGLLNHINKLAYEYNEDFSPRGNAILSAISFTTAGEISEVIE